MSELWFRFQSEFIKCMEKCLKRRDFGWCQEHECADYLHCMRCDELLRRRKR